MYVFCVAVRFVDDTDCIIDQEQWEVEADNAEEANDKAQAVADNQCVEFGYYDAEISVIGV